MHIITLDFRNRRVVFETDAQLLSESMDENITKNILRIFFRDKQAYLKGDNYTLDFDSRKIVMNSSFQWNQMGFYTRELVMPVAIFDFSDTALKWERLLNLLGFTTVEMSSDEYSDYIDTLGFLEK